MRVCLQDVVTKLNACLESTTWAPVCSLVRVNLHASERTPVATLCAQLTLLRGLRFVDSRPVIVDLRDLDMTHDTMAALKGLPDWPAMLSFSGCNWHLPASEYTQLAHCVPTSYVAWYTNCDDATVDSICIGVNEARARLGEEPLVVYANIGKVRRVSEHAVLKKW